jgi:hypothetical protein
LLISAMITRVATYVEVEGTGVRKVWLYSQALF